MIHNKPFIMILMLPKQFLLYFTDIFVPNVLRIYIALFLYTCFIHGHYDDIKSLARGVMILCKRVIYGSSTRQLINTNT